MHDFLINLSEKANKKTVFAFAVILIIGIVTVFTAWTLINCVVTYAAGNPDDGYATWDKLDNTDDYSPDPALSEGKQTSAFSSAVSKYSAVVEKGKELVNDHTNSDNPLAPHFYNLFGECNKALGRNLTENSEKSVYKTASGRFVYVQNSETNEDAYSDISDFSDWLKKRDTSLVYVLPIAISDDEYVDYPPELKPEYNESNEKFISYLSEHDIDVFDTKPFLLEKNGDFLGWFYRTDHHWTVRAGIAVTEGLLTKMSRDYGFDVDSSVCDLSKYDSVIYESSFLGSLGRKVSTAQCEPEDFEVLYPKFDTMFHVELPSEGVCKTDTFRKTLIDESQITRNYTKNSYGAFMHGDLSLIRIENEYCSNGVRVLMIKQSKANVITPYLACAVEYLDIIDPRFFDGSIRSYIEKTAPDMVMICTSGPTAGEDTAWNLK